MLTIILFVAVVIVSIVVCLNTDEFSGVNTVFMCAGILALIITIMLIATIAFNFIGADAEKREEALRYEAITYQIDNHLYENDVALKSLMDDARDWNEALASYNALRSNPWTNAFCVIDKSEYKYIDITKIARE